MSATSIAERPELGDLYSIDVDIEIAPGTVKVGTVQAISVETGEIVWKHEQRAGTTSLIATGGDLVFVGDANGRFKALAQDSGKVLWEINIGSQVTGYPVTYAIGDKQYIAVSTGSALVTWGLLDLTPELRPDTGNNLFVFALPD